MPRRQHPEDDTHPAESAVTIGDGATISGYVAGRDVVLALEPIRSRLEELIAILEERARTIREQLAPHVRYVKVQEYLNEFSDLHSRHLQSLRAQNLLLAHELLIKIHDLSFRLARDEFWARHHAETPYLQYKLRGDAFSRGSMICSYVAGDLKSYSPCYPTTRGIQSHGFVFRIIGDAPTHHTPAREEDRGLLEAIDVYAIVLESRDGRDDAGAD